MRWAVDMHQMLVFTFRHVTLIGEGGTVERATGTERGRGRADKVVAGLQV